MIADRPDWVLSRQRAGMRILHLAEVLAAFVAGAAPRLAAALAARRRTPTDLRAIRQALVGRADTTLTLEGHVDADMAFHRAVVVAAHNEVLTQL